MKVQGFKVRGSWFKEVILERNFLILIVMNKRKLVVIGGGAAGFFCAVNAARLQPELQVILLEKQGNF